MLRTFIIFTIGIWTGMAALVYGLWRVNPQPTHDNCLVFDHRQIGLDGSLKVGVPKPEIRMTAKDGRYRLGMYWMTPPRHGAIAFLQDTQSQTLKLTNRLHSLGSYSWLPQQPMIFYEWLEEEIHYGLASMNEGLLAKFDAHSKSMIGASPQGSYVILETVSAPATVEIIDTRRPTAQPYTFVVDNLQPNTFAWSPDEQLLAYAEGNTAFVLDVVHHQRTDFALEPLAAGYNYAAWSPDGQYVAFGQKQNSAQQRSLLIIYSRALELIAAPAVDSATMSSSIYATWASDGHSRTYITYSQRYTRVRPEYEVWLLDMATGNPRRVLSGVAGFAFLGDKLGVVRFVNGHWQFEVRDNDGSHPRVAFSDASPLVVGWDQGQARYFLLHTAEGGLILVNKDGSPNRILNRTEAASFNILPLTNIPQAEWLALYADFDRLPKLLVFTENGENTYDFPPELANTLPPLLISGRLDREVRVIPAPDDSSWLVVLHSSERYYSSLYRFIPTENDWELRYQGHFIENVIWSADGERFAFTALPEKATNPHLIVLQTEGDQNWELGSFPREAYAGIQWAKCGGLWAAVTGS